MRVRIVAFPDQVKTLFGTEIAVDAIGMSEIDAATSDAAARNLGPLGVFCGCRISYISVRIDALASSGFATKRGQVNNLTASQPGGRDRCINEATTGRGVIMGRPEKSLDPAIGPLQLFASQLRRLREEAGRPRRGDAVAH
jgi:hypothetical protein